MGLTGVHPAGSEDDRGGRMSTACIKHRQYDCTHRGPTHNSKGSCVVVVNTSAMKKTYALINTGVVLAVIFWNYWSNTGAINGNTVGGMSDEYANLFTPAGYAFAIWGLIYLGLLTLVVNQLHMAFFGGEHSGTILQIGPWLTIANLGNAVWLWFWLQEQTGLSVVIMLVILFSLIQIILRLNMERWDAPLPVIAAVWWPICLYSGWIAVATIANISAWLASMHWSPVFRRPNC